MKSWKELLLGLIGVLLAVVLWRRSLLREVLSDKIVLLVAGIALVHVVLLLVFDNAYVSELAGLLIDLRYYLLFVELYVAGKYLTGTRRDMLRAAVIGAGIVILFGALQAVALPKDILSGIGYSDQTIKPYLTVDMNHDYIRINSTLRGPNPVGAFAVIVLALVGAWALRHRQSLRDWRWSVVAIIASAGSLIVLVASHSRSAWIAAVGAATMLLVGVVPRRMALYSLVTVGVLGVLALGTLWTLRDVPVVSNVFFHSNPTGGSPQKSDEGHATSLQYGVETAANEPFGNGIGSTGSASLLSDTPVIVENQYLFMAHESGWLGLGLQLLLLAVVLIGLWRARKADWLAFGLCAAGVGLVLIGLLQPVWADDTVSLYWWGLAGLALGSSDIIKTHGKPPTKRKSHKKAKRAA
ncbi:O-antigen ligase family protein [Candidatus Saccharibacteria bacterium]|nr:O-antigen ligase family protein [Candidatus Saccharibacteria bacterium]